MMMRFALLLLLVPCVVATVYFKEEFGDSAWKDRWIVSAKKGGQGTLEWSAGEFNGGEDSEKGLLTKDDMKFYTVTAKFDEFSNKGKTLVLQYQAKLPKKFDCGGAYLKLYPKSVDVSNVDGDSPYNIMFGPDHCGYSTKKIHAIFNYKGKNLDKKDEVKVEYNEKDELSHLYTMIVNPDNTYDILFDGKSKASGNLLDHWPFLAPKEIDDPTDKKPADWVDEAKIADPEDKKPEGYDSIPKQIADPGAKKPDDWDDDSDGEWEAPMIDNPEFKGEWKPKMIPNPAYKGEWKPKKIPNPDYSEDDSVHAFESIAAVGIEVWNVNGGTVYDNIIITDSAEEAKAFADDTFKGLQEREKKVKEEKEKKEREEREEEEKKRKEKEKEKSSSSDDDDDDDDDKDAAKKSKDEL